MIIIFIIIIQNANCLSLVNNIKKICKKQPITKSVYFQEFIKENAALKEKYDLYKTFTKDETTLNKNIDNTNNKITEIQSKFSKNITSKGNCISDDDLYILCQTKHELLKGLNIMETNLDIVKGKIRNYKKYIFEAYCDYLRKEKGKSKFDLWCLNFLYVF